MSKKVCRVCFKADSAVYNLFQLAAIDLDGNEVPVHSMLTFCCSVEIAFNLPVDICTNCVEECTNAYNFIKMFRKSNDFLLESLKSWSNPSQSAYNINMENNDDDDNSDDDSNLVYHGTGNEIYTEQGENNAGEDTNGPVIIQAVTVVKAERSGSISQKLIRKPKAKRRYKNYKRTEMCSFCGKTYKGCLKYHEEQHINVLKYECEICNEKFISKDKIRYHRIKIHNIGSYLCSDCGQVFHNKTQLRDHTWIHTGIKSYRCEECGQQFSSPGSLKKHRLRNLCGKRKVYRPTPSSLRF